MKAVQALAFGDPEVMRTVEIAEPMPEPHQIQMDVRVIGVNFADVNARKGVYATPGAGLPRGLGLEACGTVRAVGEQVERFAIGQRVTGFCASPGYAEVVVADQDLVWAVPDTVTDDQAAAFPTVGSTAFHLVESAARLQSGESVLITAAAGGVGSVAVQICRLFGAGLVVGAAGSAARASESLAWGADAAIDYSEGGMAAQLQDAAGTAAVDVVLDGVGGGIRRSALECVGLFGRLVHFGNASGEPETLPTLREMRERNLGVVGFHLQTLRNQRRDLLSRSAETLLGWLEQGTLTIAVGKVLPLEQAAEAHHMLESRTVSGKVLLRTGAE